MPLALTEADERIAKLARIASADDVQLPELRLWNTEPCHRHETPRADCEFRACGGPMFKYQRVGVSWAYFAKKGLLADDPGLGKTLMILGLIALLDQQGELNNRALIIVQTPAALQWAREAHRWTPSLHVETVTGKMSRAERIQRYTTNWDTMIIGYHVALKDQDILDKLAPFAFVASDDVDPLLDPDNATHKMIVRLSAGAERSLTTNATALQLQLQQLHAALVPAGGLDVFGPLSRFERHFVRTERVKGARKVIGYKNLILLKERLAGMVLRRRADEVTDIRMPLLMPPSTVWLDLTPRQLRAYTALRRDALTLKRDGKVTRAAASAKFMFGQMVCAGMPALGEEDGPDAAPKLDWLTNQLTTVWNDRKVVVYIRNVGLVRAFQARLTKLGIGHATIWGQNQNATQRQAEIDRFWNDPRCRVMMGTSAMERSLNLQVANTIVFVDTLLNPARVKQTLGRIARAGSAHTHIWMFSLMMADTQEAGYEKVLSQRQALHDAVFEEESDLFEKLTATELLNLISP